jgi:DNA-directed RNA polymerase specialized sigma24 family protein
MQPEPELDQVETARQILTPGQFEAWHQVNVRGRSQAEAAARLGIGRESLRDRLMRAEHRIRQHALRNVRPLD